MTSRRNCAYWNFIITVAFVFVAAPTMAQHDHGGSADDGVSELPEYNSTRMCLVTIRIRSRPRMLRRGATSIKGSS